MDIDLPALANAQVFKKNRQSFDKDRLTTKEV